jgi:hypothetical protein
MTTNREGLTATTEPLPAAAGTCARAAGGIGTIVERPGFDALKPTPPAGDAPDDDGAERRRATRVKRKFVTQMTPWAAGRSSIPFDVIIDDLSDTGVGLIHHEPLEMGLRHLLTVPRPGGSSVTLEYLVCRCDRRSDGNYAIGLSAARELPFSLTSDPFPGAPRKRVTSRTTKILFLLFGIFGLIIAAFAPL